MKLLSIKATLLKLLPVKNFVIRYAVVIFVMSIVGIFTYMTLSIAHYANLDPTATQIADKKLSVTAVKLDEVSVIKIKELQDQNIGIESLFDNGRANPFQ